MSKHILVVNGPSYADAVAGLGAVTSRVSKFMESPEKFKLVLFTGGADIDPRFYMDTSPKKMCYSDPERDIFEISIFKRAKEAGIVMAGICRGLQLLNVLNGGKLIHHLNGHNYGTHSMHTSDGKTIEVNSLHHQMIIPPSGSILTGWSDKLSQTYIGKDDKEVEWSNFENEAAIYPKTKCFGVQYHPEMMTTVSAGYKYFFDMALKSTKLEWDTFLKPYLKGTKNDEHEKTSQFNSSAS